MKFHPCLQYLSTSLILVSALLAGCSSAPPQSAAGSGVAPAIPEQPTMADVKQIPARPMSAEELEILLEAELSGFRLEGAHAIELYIEAAERTRDIGVVTRAFEIASAFGDDERSLHMATLWREIEPGLYPDRFSAQLFARVGETEAAWELARNLNDDGVTLRIVAAETASLGDPDRSIWLDQQFEGITPAGYEIWISRALLNQSLNNTEPALDMARRAYQSRPGDIISAELYASLLAQMGLDTELANLLNDWLLAYWDGSGNQIRVARMVTQLSLDSAIDILGRAVAARQHTEELQLLLAQAYMNVPREMAAEAILSRLVGQPEYADVSHLRLAQLAERRNQFDLALQHYAAVQPSPWFTQANQRGGGILLSVGNLNDLDEYFQLQRTEYPQAADQLYLVQASLLNEIGAGLELYELTSRALRLIPNQPDLLYLRSLASDRLGRFDLVEQDLRQILQGNPQNSTALNSLGYHLADRTDRHQEAYDLIVRALRIEPENPAIIDSMGWVFFKLERYDEALAYLQEALNRYYDEEIVVHLVQTLLKMGRNQDAYNLLQDALGNNPDSELLLDAELDLDFGLTPS